MARRNVDRASSRLEKLREKGVSDDVVVGALVRMLESKDNRIKIQAIQEIGRWKKASGEFSDEEERFFGEMSEEMLKKDVVRFLGLIGIRLDGKKKLLFFQN